RFEQFLVTAYPLVHATLTREELGDPGLLYTWKGRSESAEPVILTAHYDVVPAETPTDWAHPPFAGDVADGAVWGRGALDDKSGLISIMEAAERLIARGFTPERTVLFAFGGDEEVTGRRGAGRIASVLAERGVTAHCLVDEGSAVVENTVSLVDKPIALIGTAEKGYVDLRLAVRGADGHAAMPSRRTTVGRLARALSRIERKPFPPRLEPSVRDFLKALADAAPAAYRPVLRRPRLFAPILKRVLAKDPKTDALIRTTQAPTMLSGSSAPNVLPSVAEAIVNIRILPGETIESVCARLRRVVSDAGVEVAVLNPAGSGEPIASAPTDTETYRDLCAVVTRQFPDALVAPYLVTATTDSKHYRGIARAMYRFLPVRMNPALLDTIHGVDERIGVADYLSMIVFYTDLIETLSQGAADSE
ncbi:MAG: M20/M25/M40 family metallo-hydrolase, partial [Spirochaetaceae bacterium]